jgi:hypothetical protein
MYLLFIDTLATARITIVALSILFVAAVLLVLYFGGFFSKPGLVVLFKKPVPNNTSEKNIKLYRNRISLLKDTGGVFYTKEEIEGYLSGVFPKLTQSMAGENGYTWVVGFYPMHRKDDTGKTRLDFLLVPTPAKVIIDVDGEKRITEVIDFYEHLGLTGNEVNTSPYRESTPTVADPRLLADIGFDAGHLYP